MTEVLMQGIGKQVCKRLYVSTFYPTRIDRSYISRRWHE